MLSASYIMQMEGHRERIRVRVLTIVVITVTVSPSSLLKCSPHIFFLYLAILA